MNYLIEYSRWRAKREIWIWEDYHGLEIIRGAGSACAAAFHDVEERQGGGGLGATQKTLVCREIGAGFESGRCE
jgi:hypothetical protein